MGIDIKKLSPAAQKQILEKLEEKKRQQATGNRQQGGTPPPPCGGPPPLDRGGFGNTDSSASLRMTGPLGSAAPTGGRPMTAPTGGGLWSARPTKNKLNAERVDGYASKHEAERAAELRWLEKAGKIRNLQEQVKFVLIPAIWEEIPRIGKRGKPIKPKRVCIQRELSYIADFVYTDCATGHTVVEDAKGYKGGATYRVFVNKKKMMYDIYGIKVVEV